MGTRNTSQPMGTRLDHALLCQAIDRDEAEGRTIAAHPFEVVQGRPVGVTAHVDPIAQAGSDAAQRTLDVYNPPRVVDGGDAVFRYDDGQTRRRTRVPDRRFERLRPELVSRLSAFCTRFRLEGTIRAEPLARVGLDTDKIVALRRFQVNILQFPTHACDHLRAFRSRLDILHRYGESNLACSRPRLDRLHGTSMRGQDRFATVLASGVDKRSEARGVTADGTGGCLKPRFRASRAPHSYSCEEWADVDLIERAGQRDQVAQVGHRPLTEAGKFLWCLLRLPAARSGQPARRGEVVERDHRGEIAFVARRSHAPVM